MLPDLSNPVVAALIAQLAQRLAATPAPERPNEAAAMYTQVKALGSVPTALLLRHLPEVPSPLVAEFLVDSLGTGDREAREVFLRQLEALVSNPALDSTQIARLIDRWELTPKRLKKDWLDLEQGRDPLARRTLWETLVRQNRLDRTHPLMEAMFDLLATVPPGDEDGERSGGESLFLVALGWPAHTGETLTGLVTTNPELTKRARAWRDMVRHPEASPAVLGQALVLAGSNFEAPSLRKEVVESFSGGGHASRWAPGMTEAVLAAFASRAFTSRHSLITLLTLLMELTPSGSWPPASWCAQRLADFLAVRQGPWIVRWAQELPPAVLAHFGAKAWAPALADPGLPREMRVGIIQLLGSAAFQAVESTPAEAPIPADPRTAEAPPRPAKRRGR